MAAAVLLRRAITQKIMSRNYSAHMDPKQAMAAYKMWKNLTYYVVPVVLGLAGASVYINTEEPERPEFIPYEHLRIRSKRFPWGDGNRTFFHNPHVNALPNGYEDH
ncbi:cytochrome c oxidase subunit 6A1, mitochondrial-like [Trichogramma pretiosum]|uniref:cytochrome c oxidase subunit 6A1, mitochondrial-like n=1 Tax=Trichogramma pretiosum TaxID=7493 RepID=UPI0006C95DD7|nr:cytochrome c oxidase subunit 6A1, mitochondrial-like [Trichogramma pretiosum]